MSNPAGTYYAVAVKPKRWSPVKWGWRKNPKTGKYQRVKISNWRNVYVKSGDKWGINKRLGPQSGYSKYLTWAQRKHVVTWAKRRGWDVRVGKPVKLKKYQWLDGDVDCQPELLERLNRVGQRLGAVLWIASGNRTYYEQAALYADYRAGRGPLAARPGTSNHHGGRAADTWYRGQNIGNSSRARVALRNEGLCLPVPGEAWHVEIGNTWRA